MTQLELEFDEPTFEQGSYKYSSFFIKPSEFPALKLMSLTPNYNLTFHNSGKEIGRLDFNGPQMTFTGDFDQSATVFLDWICTSFSGRLKQEYNNGYTDGQIKTSL
jgi:hypothetical protein